MRRHFVLWLLCSLVAPVAMAQDAPCPDATFQPRLLTPPALRIPRDAGLVVGLVDGGTFRDVPPAMLTRRRRQTALIRETIAPGLYRLRPDARRIYGQWELSGVPGAPPLVFGRPGIGPAPVAPTLERAERYLVASGQTSRTEVRVHFRFPVPETVVAVVIYWGDDDEPDGFAPTVATSQEVVLHRQSGACAALPEGASAPPAQGRVRVAFVGRYGQVSPRSAAVTFGQ